VSSPQSIFARYYAKEEFVDRYVNNSDGAVDVIIPVIASNELWGKNLISIYREIPVNRLLLGDAGCADDTVAVARNFPRVHVLDHSSHKTLGYSIKELIMAVETEWFIYLHSDVYLPDGWFDTMRAHQPKHDWFGCPMRITALVEYQHVHPDRPYAGSQMGRKEAFVGGLDRVDDDYVYRQEDFVFARIVEDGNFRHGKVDDTFHYHQVMPRVFGSSTRERTIKHVDIVMEMGAEEELLTAETQLRGTIKYLRPDPFQIRGVGVNLKELQSRGRLDPEEFRRWVERENPEWLPHVEKLIEKPSTLKSILKRALAHVRR
jgi:hypothetical protein